MAKFGVGTIVDLSEIFSKTLVGIVAHLGINNYRYGSHRGPEFVLRRRLNGNLRNISCSPTKISDVSLNFATPRQARLGMLKHSKVSHAMDEEITQDYRDTRLLIISKRPIGHMWDPRHFKGPIERSKSKTRRTR